MTAFAAPPGMMLVSLDPGDPEYPILGWLHGTGLNVLPLVIGHPGPMVSGEAIQFEDGRVYDPASTILFGDAESWREDFESEARYRPGSQIGHMAPPVAQAAAPAPVLTPVAPAPTIAPSGPLSFTGKAYAKASFWQANTGGRNIVFTVPGGHPSPAAGAAKITREAYFETRKTITEVSVEDLMKPADDQPELPLTDDEDDDGDDLI